MDDQTPEMERIDAQMRETMKRWILQPDSQVLKEEFSRLQKRYQQLLLQLKKGDRVA